MFVKYLILLCKMVFFGVVRWVVSRLSVGRIPIQRGSYPDSAWVVSRIQNVKPWVVSRLSVGRIPTQRGSYPDSLIAFLMLYLFFC